MIPVVIDVVLACLKVALGQSQVIGLRVALVAVETAIKSFQEHENKDGKNGEE